MAIVPTCRIYTTSNWVINSKGNAYQKVSQMYFLDNGKEVTQKSKIANHISTIRKNAKEVSSKEIQKKIENLLKTAGITIQKKIVSDS
jgi:hypothetical protein